MSETINHQSTEVQSLNNSYDMYSDKQLRLFEQSYNKYFGENAVDSNSPYADMRQELGKSRGMFLDVLDLNNVELRETAKNATEQLHIRETAKKVEHLKEIIDIANSSTDIGDLRSKLSSITGFRQVYEMDNIDIKDLVDKARGEIDDLTAKKENLSDGVESELNYLLEFFAESTKDEHQQACWDLLNYYLDKYLPYQKDNAGEIISNVKNEEIRKKRYDISKKAEEASQTKEKEELEKRKTIQQFTNALNQIKEEKMKDSAPEFKVGQKVKVKGLNGVEIWTVIDTKQNTNNGSFEYAIIIDDPNSDFGLKGKNVSEGDLREWQNLEVEDKVTNPEADKDEEFEKNEGDEPTEIIAKKSVFDRVKSRANEIMAISATKLSLMIGRNGHDPETLNDIDERNKIRRSLLIGGTAVATVIGVTVAYSLLKRGIDPSALNGLLGNSAEHADKVVNIGESHGNGGAGSVAGEATQKGHKFVTETLSRGDTIWYHAKAHLGKHANNQEITKYTSKILKLNHLDWEKAKHLAVGFKFKIPL